MTKNRKKLKKLEANKKINHKNNYYQYDKDLEHNKKI